MRRVATTERHRQALVEALREIEEFTDGLAVGDEGEDPLADVAQMARRALRAVGEKPATRRSRLGERGE